MNKKFVVIGIFAIFILVAISFSSAVGSFSINPIKKKESPLFNIRTKRAVSEKIGEAIDNIKTKYIGERVFFLPFQKLRESIQHGSFASIFTPTCYANPCTWERTADICTCSKRYCWVS